MPCWAAGFKYLVVVFSHQCPHQAKSNIYEHKVDREVYISRNPGAYDTANESQRKQPNARPEGSPAAVAMDKGNHTKER
jgi:hypothetical protein